MAQQEKTPVLAAARDSDIIIGPIERCTCRFTFRGVTPAMATARAQSGQSGPQHR